MAARRRGSLLVLGIVCSFLLLSAAPALGGYEYIGSFADNGPFPGGQGSESGQLSSPNQIDVYDAEHFLYVADTGNDRVQQFRTIFGNSYWDQVDDLPSPTGVAVDQDAGRVYVSTADGISMFDIFLDPIAGWTDPEVTGPLAVDPSTGDLLVADTAGNQIRRFDSDGTADGSFPAERPVDLAVNSEGDVFVVTTTGNIAAPPCGPTSAVERFSAAGISEGELAPLTVPGSVAVDPDDDRILVGAVVNEWFCEAGNMPELVDFAADGTFGGTQPMPPLTNMQYAAIPGLVAGGDGSGHVYALTRSPMNDSFGPTGIHDFLLLPDVTIDPAASITKTTAQLSGTVNPLDTPTTYQFEYRLKGEPDWIAAPGGSGDAGSGNGVVDVGVELTNLSPNGDYEARLTATTSSGTAQTEPVEFTTLVSAPLVQALPAGQISPSSALLRAWIDPAGERTTYYFEYGLDTSYGAKVPVAEPRPAGGGNGFVPVSLEARGLQPATVYHYRIVAENGTGVTRGDDFSFMTATAAAGPCANEPIRERQGVQFLPECRAYEMVSPPDKNGYDVSGIEHSEYNGEDFTPFTSVDGNAVAFTAHGTFADAKSHTTYLTYMARRGPDGWSTNALTPYVDYQTAMLPFQAFSDDLSSWFFKGPYRPQLTPEAPEEAVANGWYFDGAKQAYELTTPGLKRSPPSVLDPKPEFADWSEDREKIFIMILNPKPLEEGPERAEAFWFLYQWDRAAKQLRAVGREPGTNLPFGGETLIASPDIENSGREEAEDVWNPVSDDGSTVFFYAKEEDTNEPQLYVWLDGTTTQHVSESRRTPVDINGTKPATFHWASTDGRVGFFSSAEKLTNDATTGPLSEGRDLYRYEVASKQLTDITVDGSSSNGAEVQGSLGGSNDGGRLYFVARAELAPGAEAGEDNLYVWIDDGTPKGRIEFIAAGVDVENWTGIDKQGDSLRRTSRVTADGLHVMFTSRVQQSDYDNAGHREVYHYDAAEDVIRCVSCNPSGAPATDDALPVGTGDRVEVARSLSADGRFVFFATADGLVPTDVNNRVDVYRYDAELDRVDLISPGTGPFEAEFQDASADGTSVYFTTRQPLLSSDFDTNVDVYGARVEGGFLSQSPPPPPLPCVGEACRPEPGIPPTTPSESSAVTHGKGNAAERRGKKPKKQRGKCAKAKKVKNGKKACAKKKRQAKKQGRKANNRHGRQS